MTTIKDRLKFSFEIADYYHQDLDWKTTSADPIADKKGRWWLHVVKEGEIN
ncbi:hypothetical protein IQ238_17175 [Pleurocapsales cyanobacterium LEGE 06147]|nr:hypothetical protein [Pleurocapsales cyanobacterium LEGE 06147]